MDLNPNPRFDYSALPSRPEFLWPGGKRLALYVALCVEHFSYGGPGLAYSPGLRAPDSYNYAWREYGNRVGAWRLIELFNTYSLPLSVLLNTACYDHCAELVAAFVARGDEIVAHGKTNSQHPNGLDVAQERALIQEVTEAIQRHSGFTPLGWMSPGAHPSAQTEDLLAEAGYLYTLDWPCDDQPLWMKTTHGPLLSVPYQHEVNDVPMIVLHHGTGQDFADMAIDTIAEMLEQSQQQSLACCITIHSFIVGQPFRLRQFRRVMEFIAGQSDQIWCATSGQIAQHYATNVNPKAKEDVVYKR